MTQDDESKAKMNERKEKRKDVTDLQRRDRCDQSCD
jgi:hypothetical protein